MMIISSFSIGSKIYSNEDSLVVKCLDDKRAIAVLADGIGGFSLGTEASELIANAIVDFIYVNLDYYSAEAFLVHALFLADIFTSTLTF